MRSAIYGEITGHIRENKGKLTFSVKAEIPDKEPIAVMVQTSERLGRFLRSEKIETGACVMVMGEIAYSEGYPFIWAEHVAFEYFEEWARANGI